MIKNQSDNISDIKADQLIINDEEDNYINTVNENDEEDDFNDNRKDKNSKISLPKLHLHDYI